MIHMILLNYDITPPAASFPSRSAFFFWREDSAPLDRPRLSVPFVSAIETFSWWHNLRRVDRWIPAERIHKRMGIRILSYPAPDSPCGGYRLRCQKQSFWIRETVFPTSNSWSMVTMVGDLKGTSIDYPINWNRNCWAHQRTFCAANIWIYIHRYIQKIKNRSKSIRNDLHTLFDSF
jgi:hypothetical protein